MTVIFRPTDYRPLELLSECHQSLGLTEHSIQFLTNAIRCSDSPNSLVKKLALTYHSITDSKAYLKFYLTYFDKYLSQDEKDCDIVK